MKTKKLLVMLVVFVIAFYFMATAAFGWAQYRSRTNPGNRPLSGRPWIPLPPDTLTLGDDQSVWIGIENDYVQSNKKYVLYKLPVSRPFDGSFGTAGYYNNGASHSQVVDERMWFERGNPDTLMVAIILDPQPEWEVIKITNGSGGDVDLYCDGSTVRTLCYDKVRRRPVYKFTDVYHDGPDDVLNLVELTIFPENARIDEYIQPVLYEPPGTGPWDYRFVYEDPYGNPRPLGGVRWESSGPGIEAFFMHYEFEFAMIGELDHQYTYFVFDEYSGEYIKYELYTGCPDVDMEPDTWPVEVLPGGRFGITGIIGNTCDEAIYTDVWYGVMFNGIFYQQGRFNNIPLAPGQYRTAHLNQHVPWYAPPGEYEYCSYCGDYPYYILDEYCFPFTILPWSIGDGADEWYLEGAFGTDEIPNQFALIGNYPNPFNATTSISFELPDAVNVVLEVYNLLGQKVATLADGRMDAGHHSINWDASSYSSGIYFYRLTTGDKVFTKRMTLLK